MPHCFVIAKFLPQRSANWTSHYGLEKAASLKALPFLALRVSRSDDGVQDLCRQGQFLFVISPEKPTGVNDGCYFTLGSSLNIERKMLHVEPPLRPGGRTLYIHTFPRLQADAIPILRLQEDGLFEFSLAAVPHLPHRLDESSFLAFCGSVMDVFEKFVKRANDARSSGGSELVEDGWDSWSGESPYEYVRDPGGYVFEYLEPQSFRMSAAAVGATSIYQDLLLYKQIAADYSWMGVTAGVKWALKSRDHYRACGVRRSGALLPAYSFVENLPTFDESLKAHALTLWSTKIPIDGDPAVEDSDSEEGDWDDGPDVDFGVVPDYMPPVSAPSTRVIAFDIFGTILDRDGAINDAMGLLSPTHPDKRRLSEVYLECELMRHRDHADAPYTDIVRHALEDVCAFMEVPLSETVLREAVQTILQPGLYADAEAAVKTLLDQGYVLVGLPIPDVKSFVLPQLPSGLTLRDQPSPLSDLFGQNHSMFSDLLECGTADRTQVLVVTSNHYRVMEPASVAGFPTVLVQRPGCIGSGVKLGTSDPTLAVDGLQTLHTQLQNPSAHHPLPVERTPARFKAFRVCGMYQVTKLLGMGSFGNVSSAFHVLTGSEVAVKMEVPSDTPTAPVVLPYEVLVYDLLRGHPGIPSCKWSGIDRGSHILILDQLGANLQQVRRLCRGELSLKTVAMLAVEMLDRIEFVHSRGVILRDIKPENFAMGLGEKSHTVYLFDFGLAKLYVDPLTGAHIPFREGRVGLGTPQYASYNVHFGREQGRRDDIEALGNVLLFLLHGRLPWQGVYSPSIEAKLLRMGEMKAGSAFRDLLARSPMEFTTYFDHCRGLKFEDKPDYTLLRLLFSQIMDKEGCTENSSFDWEDGNSRKGLLLPEEYKLDVRFTKDDVSTLQYVPVGHYIQYPLCS
ncbi:kinase-like domain-containing protein [Suillus clintonianus]|uniref:kinase-like domain-containing protein n=1 Tax=Suillus clintonianus TaxID=1904413 RepID=UPI001B8733E6|nr:kinase-like domain-containing protein [Suillus clintonianus]KAG2145176.1 kinase-like domain-containing protein [Suillus clintonianus]